MSRLSATTVQRVRLTTQKLSVMAAAMFLTAGTVHSAEGFGQLQAVTEKAAKTTNPAPQSLADYLNQAADELLPEDVKQRLAGQAKANAAARTLASTPRSADAKTATLTAEKAPHADLKAATKATSTVGALAKPGADSAQGGKNKNKTTATAVAEIMQSSSSAAAPAGFTGVDSQGATASASLGDDRDRNGDGYPDPSLINGQLGGTLPNSAAVTQQLVQVGVASVLSLQDVQLSLPAGAVSVPVEISIGSLSLTHMARLNAGMRNVTGGVGDGYRFLPAGMRFSQPVSVTIPYDPAKLPAGKTANDVYTFYFDTVMKQWRRLPRTQVDTVNHRIVSLTNHFTDMINGTISVPDHATPQAFNPTTIKGLKAATPSAGITLIEPPGASPMGDANVSYPLAIPAGRAGMQPQLAVSYSSAGGNGWLGVGWNLDVPSISVDTRWGVPRYGIENDEDTETETETYLVGGQMLVPLDSNGNDLPLAHRTPLANRVPRLAERRFQARIEGGFARIVRHGDKPSNYWWEVTSKDGTRQFYGGTPETGLEPTAVLRHPVSGHIARWALRETRDTNGNNVVYQYEEKSDTGLAHGREPGTQLYLRDILYSGNVLTGDKPAYRVRFERDDQHPSFNANAGGTCDASLDVPRCDKQMDGRYGFKVVTGARLREVVVDYLGEKNLNPAAAEVRSRSYRFAYKLDPYGKALLDTVSQHGSNGGQLAEHRFDYHNEDGSLSNFAAPENWDTGSDGFSVDPSAGAIGAGVDPLLALGIPDIATASALYGSKSQSRGGHIFLGINPDEPVKCENAFGFKLGFNKSDSEGTLALADINGDGLPDKVYRSGGGYSYRLNRSGSQSPDATDFGPQVAISGLTALSQDDSDMLSFGGELFPGGGNVMFNYASTVTEQPTFMSDVNGDGLVDLVDNGEVWFNHLDVDGQPTFTRSNSNDAAETFYPINGGSAVGKTTVDDPLAVERNQRDSASPPMDTVMAWRANYAGAITITSTPTLVDPNNSGDGVRIQIEHHRNNGTATVYDATVLDSTTPSAVINRSIGTIAAGDRLYFRSYARSNGAGDRLTWQPVITYTGQTDTRDPQNRNAWRYAFAEDYTLAGQSALSPLPFSGRIKVEGVYSKLSATSDDIQLVVQTINPDGTANPPAYSHTSPGNAVDSQVLNIEVAVSEGQQLAIRLIADSPIDWSQIDLTPKVYYIEASDPPPPSNPNWAAAQADVQDANGNYQIILPTAWGGAVQSPVLRGSGLGTAPLQVWQPSSGSYRLQPALNTGSGTVTVSVKRRNPTGVAGPAALLQQGTFQLTNGQPADNAFMTFTATAGQAYFVEINTSDAALAEQVSAADIRVRHPVNNALLDTLRAADNTTRFNAAIPVFHGQNPHRGWYYFGYNSQTAGQTSLAAIDESKLVLTVPATPDPDDISTYPNAIGDWTALIPMPVPLQKLADPTRHLRWQGSKTDDTGTAFDLSDIADNNPKTGSIHVDLNELSTSRHGDDNPSTPDAAQYVGRRVVARMSASRQITIGGGAGGGSGSIALGVANYSILDMFDLNGDRFPDIVGGNGVQYSDVTGGLRSNIDEPTPGAVRVGDSESVNLGISGNAAKYLVTALVKEDTGEQKSTPPRTDSQMAPLGFSGSLGFSTSNQVTDFMDINGDGLPDRYGVGGSELFVALNLGNGVFGEVEPWGGGGMSQVRGTSLSVNGSGTTGFNDRCYGFGGGLNVSRNDSNNFHSLADINGDGLVDYITSNSAGLHVAHNTGGSFTPPVHWTGSLTHDGENRSWSLGGGLYFYIPAPIPPKPIYIIINPGFDMARSVGYQSEALRDIDGDGLADSISSKADHTASVRRNLSGKTSLLIRVHRPLGASFELDYARSGNTVDHPSNRWVLSEVTINDGHAGDGVDTLRTAFSYADGFHSRWERDFYGFAKVTATTLDTSNTSNHPAGEPYRRTITEFHNRDYYLKGLVKSSRLEDAAGNPFSTTDNRWELVKVADQSVIAPHSASSTPDRYKASRTHPTEQQIRLFPRQVETVEQRYEGQAQAGQATITRSAYDALGNVTGYCDLGDVGLTVEAGQTVLYPERETADDRCAHIDYSDDNAAYIVGIPTHIQVLTGDGAQAAAGLPGSNATPTLQRERWVQLETGTGNVLAVHLCRLNNPAADAVASGQLPNLNLPALGDSVVPAGDCNLTTIAATPELAESTVLSYQPNGNLDQLIGPTGYQVNYQYDPFTQTHLADITDNFGEQAQREYDSDSLKHGLSRANIDLNNERLSYVYDEHARIEQIIAPYEQGQNNATLSYEYQPDATPPVAITRHIDLSCDSSTTLDNCLNDYAAGTAASIDIATFIDGLGRALQVKQERGERGQPGGPKYTVSGRVNYDAFGRATESFYPRWNTQNQLTAFEPEFSTTRPTVTDFDILDRATTVTLPDLTQASTEYGFIRVSRRHSQSHLHNQRH